MAARKRQIVDQSQDLPDAYENIGADMRVRNLSAKTKSNYARKIINICRWVLETPGKNAGTQYPLNIQCSS